MSDNCAFVCVLGSSSKGNATAISFDNSGKFILVDAGLTPKRVRESLLRAGASTRFQRLRAIFLTHLDRDHWSLSWAAQMRRAPVPVIVRREHAEQAIQLGVPKQCLRITGDSFMLGDTASVRAIAVPHDQQGSTAYRFDAQHAHIGHATDLGSINEEFLEGFANLDHLSIESNYDEAMQIASPRPEFLKRRIMGPNGHLSNEQSVDAVCALAAQGTLEHLVLLHLSQQCNCPRLVRDIFAHRVPSMSHSTHISSPIEPSPLLKVRRFENRPSLIPAMRYS